MVNVKSDDRHQGLFGYLTSASSSWYVDFHNVRAYNTRLGSLGGDSRARFVFFGLSHPTVATHTSKSFTPFVLVFVCYVVFAFQDSGSHVCVAQANIGVRVRARLVQR